MPIENITRCECDRCITIEDLEGLASGIPVGWESIKFPFLNREDPDRYYILCPSCVKGLVTFLNESKPKEPRRPRKDKGTKRKPNPNLESSSEFAVKVSPDTFVIRKAKVTKPVKGVTVKAGGETVTVGVEDNPTVFKNLTIQSSKDKPDPNFERPFEFTPSQNQEKVDTGKDIFSTFEMRVPEPGSDGWYVFNMGGQETVSMTMKAGVMELLTNCGLLPDVPLQSEEIRALLGVYPDSPQLRQIKDILFPEVKHG